MVDLIRPFIEYINHAKASIDTAFLHYAYRESINLFLKRESEITFISWFLIRRKYISIWFLISFEELHARYDYPHIPSLVRDFA